MNTAMDPFLRLHHIVRHFQERNRFVGDAYGTGLSLLESRILTDISAIQTLLASDLTTRLELSFTAISRAIAGLKKNGLLSMRTDPNDGRRQLLQVTPKGARALAEFDDRSEKLLQAFEKNVEKAELLRLKGYMGLFADGLGATELGYERKEHLLRPEIRRITQALGLLANHSLEDAKLQNVEWHILAKMEEQSGQLLAKTIVSAFSLPPNTVAGIVRRLVKRRLITRKADTRDRRQVHLRITSHGQDVLRTLEHARIGRFRAALRSLDRVKVEEFAELLGAFIGERNVSFLSPNGQKMEFAPLSGHHDYAAARAFCATHALRLGRGELFEEKFYSHQSHCYALRQGSELFATVEIQRPVSPDGKARVTHFTQRPELDELPMLDSFLEVAVEYFRRKESATPVEVATCWLRVDAVLPRSVHAAR